MRLRPRDPAAGVPRVFIFFSLSFFNDPATTEIYTLSLHDALPICRRAFNAREGWTQADDWLPERLLTEPVSGGPHDGRSEEHTSELQSRVDLVCRLLLEKKKRELHEQHNGNTEDERRRDYT